MIQRGAFNPTIDADFHSARSLFFGEKGGLPMENHGDDDAILAAIIRGKRSPEITAIQTEFITRTGELFEPYITGARSLLIAHGAGMLACLQFISKGNDGGPPQRPNAFVAGCFCLGFCSAMIATVFGAYSKQQGMSRHWEPEASTITWGFTAFAVFLSVSFLILFLSVGSIGIALLKGELEIIQ